MKENDLTQIKGVGKKIAEKLQANGFETVEKVARAREGELRKVGLAQNEVKGIIASAKGLYGVGERREGSFWSFG